MYPYANLQRLLRFRLLMLLPANMSNEVVPILARRFMLSECLPVRFGNTSFRESFLESESRNELAFCPKPEDFTLEKLGKDRHLTSIPRFQSEARKNCEVIPKTFIFTNLSEIEKFRMTFLCIKSKLSTKVLNPLAVFLMRSHQQTRIPISPENIWL